MTIEMDLTEQAHLRASVLLRRWLAETHTPVKPGPLRLTVGPLRLSTEVVYFSATGAHGFGPIHVVNAYGGVVAAADPGVLAAACSADARARAVPEAPINAAGSGSLVEWLLHSFAAEESDPLDWEADIQALAQAVTGAEEAERWLTSHVESSLLPALTTLDSSVEQATAELLARRGLAAIGVLGRRGVVSETNALEVLARQLSAIAETHPGTEELVRHWLTSPTLTDLAALNGSQLRYRSDSGAVRPRPVHYEVPNPLCPAVPPVPGVPVPALEGGWSLRPVRVRDEGDGGPDVALVHRWMNDEHVAVNWNQDWPLEQWRKELTAQLDGDHSIPCIVSAGGREIAYVELYRVVRDKLASCYPFEPHDLGVHIAIGERDAIGKGLGSSLLGAVARGLLAVDPDCRRVVAEPNVHNGASIGAFRKAGFVREREVGLPSKNSALMVFSR